VPGTEGSSATNLSRPGLQSDSLFRLAAESLPSGVLVVGPEGTIVTVNGELERQFGYTREELIGQFVDILLPEALRPGHAAHRRRFQEAPEARSMGAGSELYGRRRDGTEFPVEISLNPIPGTDGAFVLASVVDITARRELETAARRTVEKQLEFERLIAELSVKFVNLPSDQLIETVKDDLRKIGETLEVDRCTFFRLRGGDLPLVPIALWHYPGVGPSPVVTSPTERFPWVQETLRAGQLLCFSKTEEIPNPVDRAGYEAYGIRSAVTVPLSASGRIVGALGFNMIRSERSWSPETILNMRLLGAVFGNVLARSESDQALRQTISQIERVRDQLQAENVYLRREVQERLGAGAIIGQSPAIRRVLEQIQQVAATDSTVLLLGETGSGKELLASHLHEQSARRGRMMVRVNCAAIPSALIESELFGREKGAFTGALAKQIGRFEVADRSTIFLDEIGDLPPDVQVKLLRVLEERQIERLGSPKGIHVDVRIIAATHRNLEQRIVDGSFREDLFYRLNVFPIQVPPLRERVDDIPLLVWRFVDEFSKMFGKRIDEIPRENMAALQRHTWPGNIRELRNVVERAMIVATGSRLAIAVTAPSSGPARRSLKLADVEKDHIRSVLESTGWRIRGADGAAERLGLRPTTLETRMAKLGLARPKAR
jgi:formate hydrogenlyase transcriptional activator